MEQILMLRPLMEKYNSFLVTEKTNYHMPSQEHTYYLKQVNRREILAPAYLIRNTIQSIGIMIKEKPDVIITTGVLAMIPICLLGKLTRKKVVYIESFAKVSSGTLSGKFMYHLADLFVVQWESMLKVYPKAIYAGCIY